MPSSPLPPPPAWLSPAAKAEYEVVASLLGDVGLVTGLDRALLTVYSMAVAQAQEAFAHLMSQDLGEAERSRWFRHWIRSCHLAVKAGGELGLSPMARLRLHVSLRGEPQGDLERFLDSNEDDDLE